MRAARRWVATAGDRRDLLLAADLKPAADRVLYADPQRALRLAVGLGHVANAAPDVRQAATAEWIRADALRELGRHRLAARSYQKAAEALSAAGRLSEAAATSVGRILSLSHFEPLDSVLRFADDARSILLAHQLDLQAAKLDGNVGTLLRRRDRFAEALSYYDRARSVFFRLGESVLVARADTNRANVFVDLGRFVEAERTYLGAREQFEQLGDATSVAMLDTNLARLDATRGKFQRSLQRFAQAASRFGEVQNPRNEAIVHLDSVAVLLELNQPAEARRRAGLARSRFLDLGITREAARALVAEALAAVALADPDAETLFDRARTELDRAGQRSWVATVDLHRAALTVRRWRSGQETAGNLAFRGIQTAVGLAVAQFRRTGQTARLAEATLIDGWLSLALGDRRRAAGRFRTAERRARALDLTGLLFQALHARGLLVRRRRPGQALALLREAVSTLEWLRSGIQVEELRATFVTDKVDVYGDLLALLLDREQLSEAFQVAEAAKSRALLDRIASDQGVLSEPLGDPRLESINRQLQEWYQRLDLAEVADSAEISETISRLQAEAGAVRREHLLAGNATGRNPDGGTAQFTDPFSGSAGLLADWRDIRAAISNSRTLVEYITVADELVAFVVSSAGLTAVRNVGSADRIAQIAAQLRFQFGKFALGPEYVARHGDRLRRTVDSHLESLYEQVVRPIEPWLTTEELILVPHGVLHTLPFGALRGPSGYLADRFVLSFSPSATILRRLQERTGTVGLSGNGARPRIRALALPDARAPLIASEVAGIARLFPSAAIAIGQDATVDWLREALTEADVVHLATHGVFAPDDPLSSRLKLADGWLSVHDLTGWLSRAALVVLSACETGGQEVVPGDELLGLTRGFLTAGTASLIASLWPVPDAATADLMAWFYEALAAGAQPATALALAQRRAIRNMPHPYYWAAFLLVGRPGWPEKNLSL